MTPLLSPLRVGGATVANRLAVAPMTTSQSHGDGTVSDAEIAWLSRLSNDGYGAVITCAAAISTTSIAFENQLSFGDDGFLPALRALATTMSPGGSLSLVQLCHGGSRAIPALTGVEPRSASAFDLAGWPGFIRPRALEIGEIEAIIEDFAAAAGRAAAAGFGGIELHGANGYLFTQFISTMSNRRGDDYGGSLVNRARFAREVVRTCRARVPADFVIGFRMSFEGNPFETGLDLDENLQIMAWLAEDGVDYGHVSALDAAAPTQKHPEVPAIAYLRERWPSGLPMMVAGGVTSTAAAERALALGADLVAVGRAAIGNDRVPARLAAGEALAQTPFDPARLASLAVSAEFVRYLTTAFPVSRMNIVG